MRPNNLILFLLGIYIQLHPNVAIGQIEPPSAVETTNFSKDAFSTGLIDVNDHALPQTLWDGSEPDTLEFLLTHIPARLPTPSLGNVMRKTLLSAGTSPPEAKPSLGGKKLYALARSGFVDEVRTIASLALSSRGDSWTEKALAVADIIDIDLPSACRRSERLLDGRDHVFWVKLRILCYVEVGEDDAAELTLGVLREQGALDDYEDLLYSTLINGAQLKSPPEIRSVLELGASKLLKVPVTSASLAHAEGGVLVSVANDTSIDIATRIEAAERAIAMGILPVVVLQNLFLSIELEVQDVASAIDKSKADPDSNITDAVLYQSIKTMSAPEFLRDKAQRIAIALSLGDSFHRAYSLSHLYSDDIVALEGVVVSPDEAASFALARMAANDSIGAAQWLQEIIGNNVSVSALPEKQALNFIYLVWLLSHLDYQSAEQIASTARVSLADYEAVRSLPNALKDRELAGRVLNAAFDAAIGKKLGQASLAALVASNGDYGDGYVEFEIIDQSLKIAGFEGVIRQYAFERAWSSSFSERNFRKEHNSGDDETNDLTPSLKPRRRE